MVKKYEKGGYGLIRLGSTHCWSQAVLGGSADDGIWRVRSMRGPIGKPTARGSSQCWRWAVSRVFWVFRSKPGSLRWETMLCFREPGSVGCWTLGNVCALRDDTDIKTAGECKIAAVQMGKQWAGTVHRTGGHGVKWMDCCILSHCFQNESWISLLGTGCRADLILTRQWWLMRLMVYIDIVPILEGFAVCRTAGGHKYCMWGANDKASSMGKSWNEPVLIKAPSFLSEQTSHSTDQSYVSDPYRLLSGWVDMF